MRICASDNLGNEECVDIEEVLEEGVFVEFIHPAECEVDIESGGECEYQFNICVRGDNNINLWMDKVEGVVTPDMLDATTHHINFTNDAFVGLKHANGIDNEEECLENGSEWDPDEGEEGVCFNKSVAGDLLLLECIPVNGRDNFDLTLNLTSEIANQIGPGIHDFDYWIESSFLCDEE